MLVVLNRQHQDVKIVEVLVIIVDSHEGFFFPHANYALKLVI